MEYVIGSALAVAVFFLLLLVILGGPCLVSGSMKMSDTTTISGTGAPPSTGTTTLPNIQQAITSAPTVTPLTAGTGTNQVNLIVCQDRALAASGNETLDLYGHTTPLQDIFGSNALFLHIKYIRIYLLPGQGDITGLTIGNAGSNPLLFSNGTTTVLGGTTPTFTIFPGGPAFQLGEPTAGFVVSSSHGQLLVTNNSSTATANYRLEIGGTTT